jgi:hypothetical protein
MTPPACVDCRWWERNKHRTGLCRANPPTCDENKDGEWPSTQQGDWCGKFAPRGGYE